MSDYVEHRQSRSPVSAAIQLIEPFKAGRTGQSRPKASYHAGLDGIRALAIAAVLLYHGGVSWAGGGFLGVETFFVLSGFLITSLLVAEWRRHSTIALRAFWGRRARRPLPALFCLVAVIGIYYAVAGVDKMVPGLEGDGLATLFYVGNWHQIAVGSSYFVANGPVSPLQHTWSLAIEEQFYLLWPLIVLGVLWLVRRRRGSGTNWPLATLLVVSLLGVALSAADAALRISGGNGLDRVYYGTDTRAGSLLVGAALAIALAILGLPRRNDTSGSSTRRDRSIGVIALLALASVLAMMHFAGSNSLWLYPYGLLLLDLTVAVIITAVVLVPRSTAGRMFALRLLRAIGIISYGIYLWHFPLFQWLDTGSTGLSGTALFVLRVAATLAISLMSFFLIEQPIRQRRVPSWLVRSLAPAAAGGAVLALIIAASVDNAALGSTPVAPHIPVSVIHGRPCEVTLRDASQYGLVPRSPKNVAKDEPAWLFAHRLEWGGSTRVRFPACRPKKVLLIGDSIAFTLGMGFMESEQKYDIELANGAILGCAFNNKGDLNSRGNWEHQYPGCPNALNQWRRDEQRLHAQAVVVELGWRDEFDFRWNGHVVHIGQAGFDGYVRQRINQYIRTLGRSGVPILFLSVPWGDPAPMPDGSPQPAASAARHTEINKMLAAAVAENPGHVQLLDINKTIAPDDRYQASINGNLCRFDGVHFTVYCSTLLRNVVLPKIDTILFHPSTATSPSGHANPSTDRQRSSAATR